MKLNQALFEYHFPDIAIPVLDISSKTFWIYANF